MNVKVTYMHFIFCKIKCGHWPAFGYMQACMLGNVLIVWPQPVYAQFSLLSTWSLKEQWVLGTVFNMLKLSFAMGFLTNLNAWSRRT